MERENQVATKPTFKTSLAKLQDTFVNMIVETGNSINIKYDDYQRVCIFNCLASMQTLSMKEGMDLNYPSLKENITNILQTVAMLKLNTSATPRECYIITRNEKIGDKWAKKFEMGIEGDGNDKILRTYGVDIEKVHNPWIIHEGDSFTYPSFNGLELVPPKWEPKSYTGKVIRVVYPIQKTDGSVEYHISERESVVQNLQAHVANNIMKNKDVNETTKEKINSMIANMTLDEIMNCKEALPHISPAWKSAGSRESMILRKMRNNCIKKIPKDFENAFTSAAYESTFDDYEQYEDKQDERINKEAVVEAEVNEKSMSEAITNDMPRHEEQAPVAQQEPIQTETQSLEKEAPQPTRRGPAF